MNIRDYLILLLRGEVCGAEIGEEMLCSLTSEMAQELYSLSKIHDVAHIVGAALKRLSLTKELGEVGAAFENEHLLSVFRYRRLCDELSQISELFEREKIKHIPLKGSVLRNYYPEPWMRTSCDIDILVEKDELSRAREALESALEYKYLTKTTHDISFESKTGVHLELHFELLEDKTVKQTTRILSTVWERSALAEGKGYTYLMCDDMFYFYHVLHMAKHFMCGGCGVKSFLDLWVLRNLVPHDALLREGIISKSEYSEFEKGALGLMNVWFEGKEHDSLSLSMEEFVFSGGAFGSVEGGATVGVVKRGGRLRYALGRIFLSTKTMKLLYPSLERHIWLLPVYHIRRWSRVIFKGGIRTARAQISQSASVSDEEVKRVAEMLASLGLNNN